MVKEGRHRIWGNVITDIVRIKEAGLREDSWFVEGQLCECCYSTYLCSLRDLHWAVLVSVLCKNAAQAPHLKDKHNSFELMPCKLVSWTHIRQTYLTSKWIILLSENLAKLPINISYMYFTWGITPLALWTVVRFCHGYFIAQEPLSAAIAL